MPIRDDLVIPTGRHWAGPFWALIGDQGQAVSLSGRKIHAQARPAVGASDVLYEWHTDLGNVVVSDVQVTFRLDGDTEDRTVTTAAVSLTVPGADSAAWRWTLGVYDVLVIDPDNPEATYAIVEESAVRADRGVTST